MRLVLELLRSCVIYGVPSGSRNVLSDEYVQYQ